MLQTIRDRTQGWIAWLVVGLLAVVFALWGIGSYFDVDPRVIVARVQYPAKSWFGEEVEILQSEYETAYQRQLKELQRMVGPNVDPELLAGLGIKQQTLNGLIDEKIISLVVQDAGYFLGDAHLNQEIQEMFTSQGEKFEAATFEQYARSNFGTVANFIDRFRQDLLRNQFLSGISRSAFVLPKELAQWVRLEEQTRQVGYFVVKSDVFKAGAEVSETTLKKYYEDHKAEFNIPEKFNFQYIEIAVSQFEKKVPVPSDEQLKQFYQENQDRFGSEEERRISHILVESTDSGDDAQKKTDAKLEKIKVELAAAKKFEELAKSYSADDLSARHGGDLGLMSRGTSSMPQEFLDQAYALALNKVSDPVKTRFGYHFIKVTDIVPSTIKPIDKVTEEVASLIKKQEAERLFSESVNKIEQIAFEQRGSLTPVAQAAQVDIKTTGLIPRNHNQGFAANRRITKAMFGEDVLAGNNSELLEAEPGKYMILRLLEKIPASPRAFVEVQAQIIVLLQNKWATEKAKEQVEILRKRLGAGESASVLAQEFKLEWKVEPGVKRKGATLDAQIVKAAFDLPTPQGDKPMVGTAVISNGGHAVVVVLGVTDGDNTKMDAAKIDALKQQISQEWAANEWKNVNNQLKSNAGIQQYPERLK